MAHDPALMVLKIAGKPEHQPQLIVSAEVGHPEPDTARLTVGKVIEAGIRRGCSHCPVWVTRTRTTRLNGTTADVQGTRRSPRPPIPAGMCQELPATLVSTQPENTQNTSASPLVEAVDQKENYRNSIDKRLAIFVSRRKYEMQSN